MKKVMYFTRHAVANYGSVLQSYATQKAIEATGNEAVCINYYRADEKPNRLVNTRLLTSKWNKNFLTKLVFLVTQKPVYRYADMKFKKFREILKITEKEYNTQQDLKENCPVADVYMTGSDQVWNTVTCGEIDPVYFMSFLDEGKKRVAYAGSFGGSKVLEKDREKIGKWLKKYDTVTIRENSGVEIAQSLGVEATQVLDPTFLLSKKQWQEIMPIKKEKKPYVLVYQLHPNKAFVKYAKAFAEKKGLQLIRISHCFHHIVRSGKFVCCPTPGEFLSYIYNAEYFLTDSFHGTAFAIGLNTQFVNVLPNSYSERIASILQLIGYENRILRSYDDFTVADEKIDFKKVNEKIEKERKKSIEILRKMIGD